MTKDPARVKAGKAAWAKLSPAKKAAVRARLERVRPKTTGTKVAKSTGSNNPAPAKDPTPTKPPKIGASYQGIKGGLAVLAPATDKVIRSGMQGTGTVVENLRIGGKQLRKDPLEVGKHAAYVVIDGAIDNRMQQATAISKGSASAILPELYLGSEGYNAAKDLEGAEALREAHRALNMTNSGYDPARNEYQLGDPRFRTYQLIKRVGQGIRFARRKVHFVKRLTSPVAKFMSMLGGRI